MFCFANKYSFTLRHSRAFSVMFIVGMMSIGTGSKADVYSQELVQQGIASLASLIPSSVAPGGERRIVINGSELIAQRVVSGKSSSAVEAALEYVADRTEVATPERALNYQDLEILFVDEQQHHRLLPAMFDILRMERQLAIENVEAPFYFDAGPWEAIARIPVAALMPDSPLADTPVTDGFVLLLEKEAAGGLRGSWEIRFGDGFRLLDVIGDGTEDAAGYDPSEVVRMQGTRRALSIKETTRGWVTEAWSYEAPGTPEDVARYYRDALESKGFRTRGAPIASREEQFWRLERDSVGFTLHTVHLGSGKRPVQLSMQRYRR